MLTGEQLDAGLFQVVDKGGDKRSADKVGVHNGSEDIVGLVDASKLGIESFMEGESGRFCRGIVGCLGEGNEGSDAGDGHDVALVGLDHVGEKLLHHVPVGDGVDLKDLVEGLLGHVENGMRACDAGIVDEYSRVAKLTAHGVGHHAYRLGRSHIALEVADIISALQRLGEALDVEDGNSDAALRQLLNNVLANAAATSGDDRELLGPVPARSLG